MSQATILTLLHKDHQKVAQLFKDLEKTTGRSFKQRREMFHELDEALSLLTRDHGVTHIAITITHKNHGAQLQLGSNTRTRDTAAKTEKVKMLGMQERLEMVGGGFAVESSNGVGTTITAWVPFGKATGPVADNAPDDKDR